MLLPVSIIITAIIIGVSYYAVQNNRQQSIERQQKIDIEAKAKQNEAERMIDKEKDLFDRRMECRGLYSDLKKDFYNVAGVSYSLILNTCMVSYYDTKTGELEEAIIDSFIKNK